MLTVFSRRKAFQVAGAAALAQSRLFSFQRPAPPAGERAPNARPGDQPLAQYEPFPENNLRPTVSLVQGDSRRKMVHDALAAIDNDIRPKLKTKKYVIIKPNIVGARSRNALSAANADEIHGVLDYLEPRFKGPIIIAESSAGDTQQMFETLEYPQVIAEHKGQKVSLLDLNREAKAKVIPVIDYHLHVVPIRLAERLFDPDAYVISAAVMKTHNIAVATLSVKNMVLGAPLHYAPSESAHWNDKRKMHAGIRQSNYLMYLVAQKMQPYWGATVIDGYEGMEGNGPGAGTPVPSRIAIASTDYIAADRVGVEAMGIDPGYLGYLNYLGATGVGQYDLVKITVKGPSIASVQKKYRLHSDIERELQWQGPMEEMPPNLGWVTPIDPKDIVA
jgi:uncharacterized protein (DUF362 family)